jgi:hypothetical protein
MISLTAYLKIHPEIPILGEAQATLISVMSLVQISAGGRTAEVPATGVIRDDDPSAVALYAWKAKVSAALFAPLHICEK